MHVPYSSNNNTVLSMEKTTPELLTQYAISLFIHSQDSPDPKRNGGAERVR